MVGTVQYRAIEWDIVIVADVDGRVDSVWFMGEGGFNLGVRHVAKYWWDMAGKEAGGFGCGNVQVNNLGVGVSGSAEAKKPTDVGELDVIGGCDGGKRLHDGFVGYGDGNFEEEEDWGGGDAVGIGGAHAFAGVLLGHVAD